MQPPISSVFEKHQYEVWVGCYIKLYPVGVHLSLRGLLHFLGRERVSRQSPITFSARTVEDFWPPLHSEFGEGPTERLLLNILSATTRIDASDSKLGPKWTPR